MFVYVYIYIYSHNNTNKQYQYIKQLCNIGLNILCVIEPEANVDHTKYGEKGDPMHI